MEIVRQNIWEAKEHVNISKEKAGKFITMKTFQFSLRLTAKMCF